MKRFAAEVLFRDPDDVARAQETLKTIGCNYVVDLSADGDWPTVFGWVMGESSLPEGDIGKWVGDIVDPLGGDVITWHFGEPRPIRP
jgi:hypothetical protein